MSEYVWVSSAMDNSRIKFFVKSDVGERDVQKSIEASNLNTNGKPVPQELCPNKIWADPNAPNYDRMPADNMPDLFYADGYWIVSERAADVLRQFDLGGGALYPVVEGVFREDKVTRVPGNFHVWIFGNSKSAFLPDRTEKKDPVGISGTRWNMPFNMSDNNIAISPSCSDGADVWLDGKLWNAIFISRSLGDALVSAGLKKTFFLYKARVV